MTYDITIDGQNHHLDLARTEAGWTCRLDGASEIAVNVVLIRPNVISLILAGKHYEITRESVADETFISVGNVRYSVIVRDPRVLARRKGLAGDDAGPRRVLASMPGKVVRVLVEENAEVQAGQGLLIVEAMKMQNEIKSPKAGWVRKLFAAEGAAVNAGEVLAIVE